MSAARRVTDYDPDGLALKIGSLRRNLNGPKENEEKPNADFFHIPPSNRM
jgi:hypothetical protein